MKELATFTQGRLHKIKSGGRDLSKGHQKYDSDVISRDGCKRRSLGYVNFKFWSLPKARAVVAITHTGGKLTSYHVTIKNLEYFSWG